MSQAKKIGILIEKHFDETEFVVFNSFFPYKGYDVEYLSYLWGTESLSFEGNDQTQTVTVRSCISQISAERLREYAGIILIGGYAMDRLRYDPQPKNGHRNESEAVRFLRKCAATPGLKIGTICHSLWLFCAAPDLLRGKKVTCAHNILCDVLSAGGDVQFGSEGTVDLVVDGNLISAKHPGVVMKFAEAFLTELRQAGTPSIVTGDSLIGELRGALCASLPSA